jgi:long-chain fatty acid transport protein
MKPRLTVGGLVWMALATAAASTFGQGIIIPSAGPINSAMAGASTAAPIEFGSTYWNPANLSGLENQEFLLGTALTLPSIHMEAAVPAGAVRGRIPPTNRYGESRSNSGVASGLATGVGVRMTDDSPITFGLGVFGLSGGGVNFAGSLTTPLLTPRVPPKYAGFGPIYSNIGLLAIAPSVAVRLCDGFSIGAGPVITTGTATFAPAFFAPGPVDASTNLRTFPYATNARPFWGGGFQVGLLYEVNENWNVGFSYKSQVWQERWSYNASFPDLAPRHIGLQAGLPPIYSWGVAYKGLPKTLIDVDVRYFDYANTPLFGQKVIDGGLGWQSVFAVATGIQYRATDQLALLGGYLFNTNPIPAPVTLFNAQAPGIITNTLSLGASLRVTDNVTLSLAWMHGFRNSINGPILQLPRSTVRLDAQTDTLLAGLNVTFGGSRRPQHAEPVDLGAAEPAAPTAVN